MLPEGLKYSIDHNELGIALVKEMFFIVQKLFGFYNSLKALIFLKMCIYLPILIG